eukprot:13591790-Alexandrium_andersonii.AAC.1
MSASLVGSEMCIRDRRSLASTLRSPQKCRARARAAKPPARHAAHGPRPVSYTHLTLPTICSV